MDFRSTFIYEVSYTVCIFTIDERFTRPTRRSAASRGSVDYRSMSGHHLTSSFLIPLPACFASHPLL
eukprot:2114284-Pleurochrysis_carterae.AAC.4